MNYQTNNGLKYFDFNDSQIQKIEIYNNCIHVFIQNVKILPTNPCNKDIIEKRTNDFDLVFINGTIINIINEGYIVYDADMKLSKKYDDEIIAPDKVPLILNKMDSCYIYAINQESNTYQIIVDLDDHTYRLEIKADSTQENWTKFLNL